MFPIELRDPMKKQLDILTNNTREVLAFLKSKYHFIHLSNVFFRDLQYGLTTYLESKGVELSYGDSEELTAKYVALLERANILKPLKHSSWMLNYPEFKKPPVKPAAPTKPAAAATPRLAAGSPTRRAPSGAPASSGGSAEPVGTSNVEQSQG